MPFGADEVKASTIGPLCEHRKCFYVVITRNGIHWNLSPMEDLQRPEKFGKGLETVLFPIDEVAGAQHRMNLVFLGQIRRPSPGGRGGNGGTVDPESL
jgi:hypothetical protein